MSYLASEHVEQTPVLLGTLVHDDGERGRYVTDGFNLYRLLGRVDVADVSDGMIGVEDCHSLDVFLISDEELVSWRLRSVAPSALSMVS